MQSAYLHYGTSQIHYAYSSNGTIPCICFHGYGESLQSFEFLEQQLPASYRLIAIDMPLHGQTVWKEGVYFTVEDLKAIVHQLLNDHGLPAVPVTLLGFSMGGRVALSLLQAMPQQVNNVVLLAPDGLVMNKWHWLATQTRMGNRLFAFTMGHAPWFRALLRIGKSVGLVNKSIYKFTRYYIQDEAACRQLYERWTCLATLVPDMQQIIDHIRQYNIQLHLLYGEQDRIVRPRHANKIRQQAAQHCTVRILPGGHQLLQEKNAEQIVQCLIF